MSNIACSVACCFIASLSGSASARCCGRWCSCRMFIGRYAAWPALVLPFLCGYHNIARSSLYAFKRMQPSALTWSSLLLWTCYNLYALSTLRRSKHLCSRQTVSNAG
ncbi:hypothetical protein COO60DRAFT_403034 [Scenedesmus sp. NREL 46B-D3]|nr:hypothetical protein COO60DRAFT_403034 [Scenedesmus sp. NREL 46B-D3]